MLTMGMYYLSVNVHASAWSAHSTVCLGHQSLIHWPEPDSHGSWNMYVVASSRQVSGLQLTWHFCVRDQAIETHGYI